jgi:hypothetical protein
VGGEIAEQAAVEFVEQVEQGFQQVVAVVPAPVSFLLYKLVMK